MRARPGTAASFSLTHPQHGPRRSEERIAMRVKPGAKDVAAGWSPRPQPRAPSLELLHHREHAPQPPRAPTALQQYMAAHRSYIKAVELACKQGKARRSISFDRVLRTTRASSSSTSRRQGIRPGLGTPAGGPPMLPGWVLGENYALPGSSSVLFHEERRAKDPPLALT